jgi:hypothetical protein
MSLFQEYVLKPYKINKVKGSNGIPIPLDKLSKVTNYIEKSKNIIVSGRPNSGKSTFIDYVYFINIFKWWTKQPAEERPKIQFLYFSMRKNLKVKFQKWLCLYLKLEYNIIIDIPTLNNGIGKLYDLDEETEAQIVSAYEFFDELENNHLIIYNGRRTPSDIYFSAEEYMKSIGHINEYDNSYTLDPSHAGQYTFLIADNVEYLLTEHDGFGVLSGDLLKKKFTEYLDQLKFKYNLINIINVPTKTTFSRGPRDTEPNYKDLGIFNDIADLGVVLYNPFNENNLKYNGYPVESLFINGKNRFRTLTVVSNQEGLENQTLGLFFIGECGYFAEAPHPTQKDKFEEKLEILRELH